MKKVFSILLLFVVVLITTSCRDKNEIKVTFESECGKDPFASECYEEPTIALAPEEKEEKELSDNFNSYRIGNTPSKWVLFKDEEYKGDEVTARVESENPDDPNANKYVKMTSDGSLKHKYPADGTDSISYQPTFVFSSDFNLSETKKGVATGKIKIDPTNQANVEFSIATGAVNSIGVILKTDGTIQVKKGGPFFYYNGANEAGDFLDTDFTYSKGIWIEFKFEWDVNANKIEAFIKENNEYKSLNNGNTAFHISNRGNALQRNPIIPPNVIRVIMPFNQVGVAYLDDINVGKVAN